MTMIQRPLIVGTLVGFIYGNPVEGMIIGAQFELLSMGLVGIGAHSGMPEITLGSALCTGFVLWKRNRNRGSAGAWHFRFLLSQQP